MSKNAKLGINHYLDTKTESTMLVDFLFRFDFFSKNVKNLIIKLEKISKNLYNLYFNVFDVLIMISLTSFC